MTDVLAAYSVNMAEFQRVLTSISPKYSVCVRGKHGIGKSESVYQGAQKIFSDFYKSADNCKAMVEAFKGKVKVPESELAPDGFIDHWKYEYGIPVIERRLSQLTEGDIIGLPFENEKKTATVFKPCEWLINATNFPSLLFLDERNRAIEGVKQAVFQLTDSKIFYGHVLHAESRIVIAENHGDAYDTEDCDPAELSRSLVYLLEPTVDDWLNYARGKIHLAFIEFITNNHELLEHTGMFESNKKYQDRRAWFNFGKEAGRMNLLHKDNIDLLRIIGGGFIGLEAINAFVKFVKEDFMQVTAKDIMTDWQKAKVKLQSVLANNDTEITGEQMIESSYKIDEFLKQNEGYKLNMKEAYQIALFMRDCGAEAFMNTWAAVQQNNDNTALVHAFIKKPLTAQLSGKMITGMEIPTIEEVENLRKLKKKKQLEESQGQSEQKTRGARQ